MLHAPACRRTSRRLTFADEAHNLPASGPGSGHRRGVSGRSRRSGEAQSLRIRRSSPPAKWLDVPDRELSLHHVGKSRGLFLRLRSTAIRSYRSRSMTTLRGFPDASAPHRAIRCSFEPRGQGRGNPPQTLLRRPGGGPAERLSSSGSTCWNSLFRISSAAPTAEIDRTVEIVDRKLDERDFPGSPGKAATKPGPCL